MAASATAARDDLCELGAWIHGEGTRLYGERMDFHLLRHAHVHFHREAGSLLALIEAGRREQANALLDDLASPYNLASDRVISLLRTTLG